MFGGKWSEAANKFKANLANLSEAALVPFDAPPAAAGAAPPAAAASADASEVEEYVRLPLGAARKLRLAERPDLSKMLDVHAKEQRVLLSENEALRGLVASRLVRPGSLSPLRAPQQPRRARRRWRRCWTRWTCRWTARRCARRLTG